MDPLPLAVPHVAPAPAAHDQVCDATPVGIGSESVAFVAVDGPLLVTTTL